jgi:hypothetical protein
MQAQGTQASRMQVCRYKHARRYAGASMHRGMQVHAAMQVCSHEDAGIEATSKQVCRHKLSQPSRYGQAFLAIKFGILLFLTYIRTIIHYL